MMAAPSAAMTMVPKAMSTPTSREKAPQRRDPAGHVWLSVPFIRRPDGKRSPRFMGGKRPIYAESSGGFSL